MTQGILIIGNGSSVMSNEFGTEIDTFPTVARINNYITTGFEPFTGTKTDIWINGANSKLKKRPDLPGKIVVLIPSSILNRKGTAIHKRIVKRLGVNTEKYLLVPENEIIELETQGGVDRLTTGTGAILWALKNYENVVIHGFDFFQQSKTHYFDAPLTRFLVENNIIKKAEKHDMETEKSCIDKLVKAGKVIKLTDYLK